MHCMAAAHCLRGRQMDEHRRTINYLHTGHTRYFMCGPQLTQKDNTKPVLSVASFALLRARLPRVNKVSYTSL